MKEVFLTLNRLALLYNLIPFHNDILRILCVTIETHGIYIFLSQKTLRNSGIQGSIIFSVTGKLSVYTYLGKLHQRVRFRKKKQK